jgi:hypothetical protein
MEAADLGVRLCQHAAVDIYRCYAVVAVPVLALALASLELGDWVPNPLIWCAKPWLDRTILFVLARSAFGQRTTIADMWRAQRDIWWRGFVFTWVIRRLSPWRSFTEPVYQLEGLGIRHAGTRLRQLRRGKTGMALMMTQAFSWAELSLHLALLSLLFWFAPQGQAPDVIELLFTSELPVFFAVALPLAYWATVFFLEPFYVAAGFSMYLHRRAELEAWDIEQEFRRAFPRRPVTTAAVLAIALCVGVSAASAQPPAPPSAPSEDRIQEALERLEADPNLAAEQTIKTLRWREATDKEPDVTPGWLKWISGFFAWVAQSMRLLVWAAAIVLAGVLVVAVVRLAGERRTRIAEDRFIAPTHVGDVDIRPESLPADPGAAARVLWDGGAQRAALALLYRALLSRLVHAHRVPIRDSSTEGDCLTLASRHLAADRRDYTVALINAWRQFVYAGRDIHTATVHALCERFSSTLDVAAPAAPVAGGTA